MFPQKPYFFFVSSFWIPSSKLEKGRDVKRQNHRTASFLEETNPPGAPGGNRCQRSKLSSGGPAESRVGGRCSGALGARPGVFEEF